MKKEWKKVDFKDQGITITTSKTSDTGQIQVLTQVQMQDLMQEQIPVPIKEWSRTSVKDQIQINTTKKNVRMHILFCCHKPGRQHSYFA